MVNVKFSAIEFKKEQAGVHNYTVEEVAGTDATVTYDTMKVCECNCYCFSRWNS